MENQNSPDATAASETSPTREAAAARIQQLTADKAFAARYAQNDGAAVAELRGLQELAYLGKPLPGAPTTPEAAKVKLNQLTSSPDFARKVIENPGGPEQRELTQLERMASGMNSEAQPPPAPREPGVPAEPSSYRFVEPPPAGSDELVKNFQTAAHSASLTLGEFEAVHQQALRDTKANAGLTENQIVENLDRDLRGIWGKDYDRRTELLERYVADYERDHPGTLALVSSNPALRYNKSLIVFLAGKALRKYGG